MTCRLTLQKGLQVSQLMCDLPILHITRRCGSPGIIRRREVGSSASVLPDRTTLPNAYTRPDRNGGRSDEFENYEFNGIMRGNQFDRQPPRGRSFVVVPALPADRSGDGKQDGRLWECGRVDG